MNLCVSGSRSNILAIILKNVNKYVEISNRLSVPLNFDQDTKKEVICTRW